METIPAGWYPDPANPLRERLWDGSKWLERTRPRPPAANVPNKSFEAPPPPLPAPQPEVTTRTRERDYSNRVMVVKSAIAIYWIASYGALLAGAAVGRFRLRPDLGEYVLVAAGLVGLVATITLVVSGIRHSREARRMYYFVPSAITSIAVVIGSIVLYLVTHEALGLPSEITHLGDTGDAYIMSALLSSLMITIPIGLVFLLQLGGLFHDYRRSVVVAGLGFLLLTDAMYRVGELGVAGAELDMRSVIALPWILLYWLSVIAFGQLWKSIPAHRRERKAIAAEMRQRMNTKSLSQAELLDIALTGPVDIAKAAVHRVEDIDVLKIIIRKTKAYRVKRVAKVRLRLLKRQARKGRRP